LEEVQEGALMQDGRVTMAGLYGVFVYFGAVRDGRLLLPRSFNTRFKAGDVIPYCQVASVDLAQMRVALQVDSPQDLVDELDAGRLAVEEFQVGLTVDGYVNAINSFGIFVNVKAVRDARLRVPKRKVLEFQVGQLVEGMTVTAVDPLRSFITLELPGHPMEGPEEVEQPAPPAKTARVARPKAKAALKPKAQAEKTGTSSTPGNEAPRRRWSRAALPVREPSPGTKPKGKPKAVGGTGKAVAPSGRKLEQEEDLERAQVDAPRVGCENVNGGAKGVCDQGLAEEVDAPRVGCEKVNGVVKGVCDQGLAVEAEGLPSFSCILRPPERMLNEAQEGDFVKGMLVSSVDMTRRQVFLSMKSPELTVHSEI